MTVLKLYHKDKLIGTITDVVPEDTFEMSGDIDLTEDAENYREMFSFLTHKDETNSKRDSPFDESYLDGWSIEDETGSRTKIACPGIYFEANEILWRE